VAYALQFPFSGRVWTVKRLTKKSLFIIGIVALFFIAACGNVRRKPFADNGDPQGDSQVITHCPVGLDIGTLNYHIDGNLLSVAHVDDDLALTATRQSGESNSIYGIWRFDGNFSSNPKIDLVLFLHVSPNQVELLSSCGSGTLTRSASVSSPATITDTQITIHETHDSY